MSSAEVEARRILVVDDERVVALDLKSVLEEHGYVVRIAGTCEQAIQVAAQFSPHLVLMDIWLGGPIDGIETVSLLLARHPVAVVYLTASLDPAMLERALETRPGGYLVKPYKAHDLRNVLAVALAQHASDLEGRKMRADLELRAVAWKQRSQDLTELVEQLREEVVVDPLTGAFNRRYLDGVFRRELSRAQRDARPLGVILLDLDHFKALNDEFGHPAGDSVLKEVASCVRGQLRTHDTACRIGGEEFVVLLPDTGLVETHGIAERLRGSIERLAIQDNRSVLRVTASFGISVFPEDGNTTSELLRVADAGLYVAKQSGRNRIAMSQRAG